MTDLIKESLNKVKQTLQNSTQQIVTFKQQNKDFRNQLVSKITAILTQIQELSKNSNGANLKVVLADLDSTRQQLQQTQQELGLANQRLQSNQLEIDNLKQEKKKLEEMGSMSGQQMAEIEARLKEKEITQAEILDNIKQVNDLLSQQVTNISEMVQESTGYNQEYDTQINAIESNLQNVVNLLNNNNNSNSNSSSKTSGGKRSRRRMKKKYVKNFKGGYNWSNSLSSLSSTRRKHRR